MKEFGIDVRPFLGGMSPQESLDNTCRCSDMHSSVVGFGTLHNKNGDTTKPQ